MTNTTPEVEAVARAVAVRLRARAEQQKDNRGDYFYRGQADSELEEAANLIERLVQALAGKDVS